MKIIIIEAVEIRDFGESFRLIRDNFVACRGKNCLSSRLNLRLNPLIVISQNR